jgi:hypothetical protein
MKSVLKMKLLFTVIIICLLFTPIIFAQEKVDTVHSKGLTNVVKCLQFLDSLAEVQNKSLNKTTDSLINGISLENLKHDANLIYSATDENYSAFSDSLSSKATMTMENQKKDSSYSFSPGALESQLLSKIRSSIPPVVGGLTSAAYVLRIHVNSLREVKLYDKPISLTLVSGTIKEVYKGSSKFNIGDSVHFLHFAQFVHFPFFNGYKTGQEYIVPIEHRIESQSDPDDDNSNTLAYYFGKSFGYFSIVDGNVIDKFNFFGFGDKVEFKIFDKKLRDKIKEIKSW